MISHHSINFGDQIKSDLNSSNYLISAFAKEDEDEKDSEDKIKKGRQDVKADANSNDEIEYIGIILDEN